MAKARQLAPSDSPGSDLIRADVPAEQVKIELADRRAALMRSQSEIADARRALVAEMEAQMAAAREALAPLEQELKQLHEGIWTVNLYLGRDEEIVSLRGGEPAPAETPIHLRQLVLSMDEETAIGAEQGGIDHADITQFDEWLLADPNHLDQVLPEPRGVVVLVPRRRGRDYGDVWANDARNKENIQSYWLIRNGQRLYRMRTDFVVGKTILPKRSEFTDLFYEDHYNWQERRHERAPIDPGSSAWLKAEEKQDSRQRHYMRSALILQGLIDRTSVFDPKPAYHVSFVNSTSYEAGHVVLINDAEDDRMLTTGREPFYTWLARLNSQLHPGMRIIGAFETDAFRHETSDGNKYGSPHLRLTPSTTNPPPSNVIHYLDGRRDGGLVFKYQRTDEIWDNAAGGFRPSKTRASCVVYPSDRFVVPFDLVSIDEMRSYLQARLDRHAYEDMFPLLNAAIALKEAEAAAEAPMRDLITAQLINAGADPDHAADVVPGLVEWWKLANKWHRPLVSDGGPNEAKAIKTIVAEYRRRQNAITDPDRDNDLIERLRTTETNLIAQRRDGRWVVLAEPRSADRYSSAITANTWCTEHTYPRTGHGQPRTRDWVLPGTRTAQWRVVWASERWAGWNLGASLSDHLSGPEIDALGAEARRHTLAEHGDGNTYLGTTYQLARHDDIERTQIKVWLIPDHGADPNYPVRYLTTTWSRNNRGHVTAHHARYLHSQTYSGTQLFGRYTRDGQQCGPALIHVDDSAVTELNNRVAGWKSERDAKHAEWGELWALELSVQTEWERRWMVEQYDRFMEDYRDETLWPAHKARLHPAYPHRISHRGTYGNSELMTMLSALKATGHRLDGKTIAELAAAYTQLGHAFQVPDDIADITLTAPAPTSAHGPRAHSELTSNSPPEADRR
ncbi:hypothetical protein ACFV9C_42700 [Kribbella sp. NPDC059898]|uniref:hypothetical protein n=1 Tax=Kribbella sp. NPDC059898 TaxID=3346995 RepID=UPI003657CEBD